MMIENYKKAYHLNKNDISIFKKLLEFQICEINCIKCGIKIDANKFETKNIEKFYDLG